MAFDGGGVGRRFRRPPSVYTGREDSPRHATWLELFFDLVFVVAIAEIGTNLHHNMTLEGVLYFTGVFVLVWWVWLDFSYYTDLYAADDAVSRLSLIGVMFVVIFLSQTVDSVFHGDTFAFGATVLFLRVVLTVLYLRPRPNVSTSETRWFVATWVASELLTTTVWTVSLFVPDPGRFGLWMAAFTINMAGVAVMYTVFDTVLVQVSHFPERLGLITIVVLGETILAVSFGTSIATSGLDFQLSPLLVGLAGFVVAVGAWWLYFQQFEEDLIDLALRAPPDRRLDARRAALVYVFSHFLVHIGIVATGVGVVLAIEATTAGTALDRGGRLVLCGGAAAFLVGCAVLHRATLQVTEERRFDDHVLAARVAAVVVLSALVPTGGALSTLALVGVVALAFAALVVFETLVHPWVDSPPAVESPGPRPTAGGTGPTTASRYGDRLRRAVRRPPSVSRGGEGESEGDGVRHATWLELFFDLVFVVAVAELGSYLHHHLTLRGVLAFVGLFLMIWWVWLGYSYYADLFETDDPFSRLSMIVAMFVVIFLAQTADEALAGESFAFGVAVLVLRAIIAVFYYRAQYARGVERRFVRSFAVSNVFSTAIIGLSLLVPEPGRFGLWAAAVVVSLGGAAVIYTVLGDVVVQSSHLPERLGLLTIVVLGETVLAVSFGTSITDPGPGTLAVGALGFFVAVAVWWIYFQHFDENLINRILHPSDEDWLAERRRGLVYTFSHYFTHMGIVAAGVGIIVLLEASLTDHALEPGGVGVLCAGVALFLVGSVLSQGALPQGLGRRMRNARVLVAGGLLVYPGLGIRLSPVVTLVLIAGLLFALVALDDWVSSAPTRRPDTGL